MKAATAVEAVRLEDIPNVGPAIAGDLRSLGIDAPAKLIGADPFELHDALSAVTGVRQDPCVLDTFMAAVDFMGGGEARPWWEFTAERKRLCAERARADLRPRPRPRSLR